MENGLLEKYKNYTIRDIVIILESYSDMKRKMEFSNQSELIILENFCKYLNKTGSVINETDIMNYIFERNKK